MRQARLGPFATLRHLSLGTTASQTTRMAAGGSHSSKTCETDARESAGTMAESGMTYRCSACGGIFEKGWSDQEAEQDAREKWGVPNAMNNPEMTVVCDDCYQQMMAWEASIMRGWVRES